MSNPIPRAKSSTNILDFQGGAHRIRLARELKKEARALILIRGPNPYSDFLLRNESRPNRQEAASIGRLMYTRVKALDGSLQPKRLKSKTSPVKRSSASLEKQYIDDILRLQSALINLAKNEGDPVIATRYIDPLFGDAIVIRQHLSRAVLWINRFAEEWDREQRTHGSPALF